MPRRNHILIILMCSLSHSLLPYLYVLFVHFAGILKQVLDKCIIGASVREICEYSDKLLVGETSKVFKKEKDLKKGIAFPTCISVNNCICHFSPIASEPDLILKDEDMVKV